MTSPSQRGFTLIELIIFIVIVGAGVAGILSVYTNSIKSSADPLVQKQTVAIAESLLEEILQKEYAKPAGSAAVPYGTSGWSRSLFDTVTDYNNYTASAPVDGAGSTVAGLSGYSMAPAVTVTPITLNGVVLLQVVVSVTGPQGTISLTGYRGSY